MMLRGGVDGIICVPASESPQLHEKVARQIPMVLIDRYFRDTTLPYVCTDNYTGAKMAAELLLKKEYKCILAIQGVPGSIPNQERVRGFVDTLEGHHVDFDIVGNAFSIENGYRETCRAFGKKKYDAVFAFSATILLGVLKALRERNRKIGKDVGVVSYDNNGFLEFMEPAITCKYGIHEERHFQIRIQRHSHFIFSIRSDLRCFVQIVVSVQSPQLVVFSQYLELIEEVRV